MMGRLQLKRPNRQGGISLLEVLLSLTIVIILLVMATRYFLVASLNQKINNTISEISGFQAAVSQWMSGPGAVYSGATLEALNNAGMIPQQLITGTGATTAAINPWGGAAPTWAPVDTTGVTFTMKSIPSQPCLNLQQKYLGDTNATVSCAGDTAGTLIYVLK